MMPSYLAPLLLPPLPLLLYQRQYRWQQQAVAAPLRCMRRWAAAAVRIQCSTPRWAATLRRRRRRQPSRQRWQRQLRRRRRRGRRHGRRQSAAARRSQTCGLGAMRWQIPVRRRRRACCSRRRRRARRSPSVRRPRRRRPPTPARTTPARGWQSPRPSASAP